ncbi:MAG: cysteine--tRNA ligase [Bdellovibrionaceae bacterium]|nr:cysteine--tRNA ligase [Bdellovibrio sp.]
MLRIYNTLSRTSEEFKPITPGKVSIYVCGPTVYGLLHVGNFRGQVFFNFVRNWLEHLGYHVDYALNFTDVDDKIINKANEEKKSPSEVSEYYIEEYKKDFKSLALRMHDRNPKVTEFMPQIVTFISNLIEKKKAYTSDGVASGLNDVNFSISDFKDYGKLSGRKPEELQSGVRIEVNEKKKNPLDFALWKSAKDGEISWPSPWGQGRPGWHIECSAMIKGIYGEQIDIHGGGLDLMFPHHENEIAQSESCSTSGKFSNYWMHWNMIQFSGSKMSKSLGNIIYMRDFLKDHHAEVYKWMMLTPHYRSTADYSEDTIHQAVSGLARVYSSLALAESIFLHVNEREFVAEQKYHEELQAAWNTIEAAFNDDFGTPSAFAVLFEVVRKFNAQFRRGMKVTPAMAGKAFQFFEFIKKFGGFMSLFQEYPTKFLIELDNQLLKKLGHQRADIDVLVAERARVRDGKDFAKADEIRKQLTEMHINVSDLATGSFWEVMK